MAGVDPREYPEKMLGGYEKVRTGASDPAARIGDQELDGLGA